MFEHAIVRTPGPDAISGLTTQTGEPPDLAGLKQQHRVYCKVLASLGLTIVHLAAEEGFPDAYFVEDTAVVTPEVAVITRPGAPQRRGEEQTIASVLSAYRPLKAIARPGTLDGGDVMIIGRRAFIGLSRRTNRQGADQLCRILAPFDYQCTQVVVNDGLHLKSSVNSIGGQQLLIIETWAGRSEFDGFEKITVGPSEAHACNTLWINDHLIVPDGYPATRTKLEATGKPVMMLETDQIRRMDGGLTCLSIRL